jgi:hypothetical protein
MNVIFSDNSRECSCKNISDFSSAVQNVPYILSFEKCPSDEGEGDIIIDSIEV